MIHDDHVYPLKLDYPFRFPNSLRSPSLSCHGTDLACGNSPPTRSWQHAARYSQLAARCWQLAARNSSRANSPAAAAGTTCRGHQLRQRDLSIRTSTGTSRELSPATHCALSVAPGRQIYMASGIGGTDVHVQLQLRSPSTAHRQSVGRVTFAVSL